MIKQKQHYEHPLLTEMLLSLSGFLANSFNTTNEDFTLDETPIQF